MKENSFLKIKYSYFGLFLQVFLFIWLWYNINIIFFRSVCSLFKVLEMTEVEVTPGEGKTSFSGIPESQFIDDVDSYMQVV